MAPSRLKRVPAMLVHVSHRVAAGVGCAARTKASGMARGAVPRCCRSLRARALSTHSACDRAIRRPRMHAPGEANAGGVGGERGLKSELAALAVAVCARFWPSRFWFARASEANTVCSAHRYMCQALAGSLCAVVQKLACAAAAAKGTQHKTDRIRSRLAARACLLALSAGIALQANDLRSPWSFGRLHARNSCRAPARAPRLAGDR